MQSTTIYRGLSPINGRAVEVRTEQGKITAISPTDAAVDRWIAPGLIDIQVNGYAGVDYNTPEAPLEELARSIAAQRAAGVTRLLPTVITGSAKNMTGSLRNLARARRELPEAVSFAGFHVEGPWISPDDGPRGAHPKEHVRAASVEEFDRFQDAAEGGIRLLTLAPESPGAIPVIEHAVDRGVIVAIGHCNSDRKAIADAIRAGATMSTHLGNGAHSHVPRHDNYILFQMAADELWAGLIVDGVHLPAEFVKVAVRAKGLDRIILVTDAVPPAGCQPGAYRFGHLDVELTPDMRVQLRDSGRLAGSALSMDRGLENLMRFAGLSWLDALRSATVNPARAMGFASRSEFLEVGQTADLMLCDYDAESRQIQVRETIVADRTI